MKLICAIALLLLLTTFVTAQEAAPASAPTPGLSSAQLAQRVPAPKPSDVDSLDGIVKAAYDSISGPMGPRDWKRFRSLFLPEARFTEVGRAPDGSTFVITLGVEDFIREATDIFAKEPFFENGVVNQPQRFGNMAQVFSSYESRHAAGEKPFERGINSFQVLYDGTRWWIISIFWDTERPGNPLPENLEHK